MDNNESAEPEDHGNPGSYGSERWEREIELIH